MQAEESSISSSKRFEGILGAMMEKKMETVGIIGYRLGYILGFYWDNENNMETRYGFRVKGDIM